MNELIELLAMLSDGQLLATTQQIDAFDAAAQRAVTTLRQLTIAANGAAAALQEVILAQKQI